ncbi:MAG TPA: tetratricopeptide repeat protein [Terracidiphilus sp.]|nr:tetratricopeptide repeat protein [Terracidiphilus sp.]
MSRKSRLGWSAVLGLCSCAALVRAQGAPKQGLEAEYQSAVAEYNAGQYAKAAHQLEDLLPYATKNFDVHELLGLSYASMSESAKAMDQLQLAVQLRPDSAAGRTNLGAMLLQAGKADQAAVQFRKALQLEPANYNANHDLGELYAQSGRLAEAQPLLATAYGMKPDDYDNGYNLAMADFLLGRMEEARKVIQRLEEEKNTGELHNLLAQIEEKQGNFVNAASEYETAAHLDPSEDNLFDWGSEMLMHSTYEPAISIFQAAVERYPESARLQIGLGLALYSRDRYDEAVTALLKAVALKPDDARCYYFLSKAYDSAPSQADDVIQAFRGYAARKPENALAQYYYALSLWKGHRTQSSMVDLGEVESLLKKAVALNGGLPDAHVQLGDLYADQHLYEKAAPEYERALALNPNLPDAHYRLATDYVHLGQKEKAQQQFAEYQKLRAEHLAELDKQQAEVKRFVYSAKAEAGGEQ